MASKDAVSVTDNDSIVDLTDYDPELDFLSEQFNPLKALNTPGLKPPDPDCTVYDNIAKYESVVIKGIVLNRGEKMVQAEAGPSALPTRKFLPHQMPVKRKEVKVKNIFTRMESEKGPLKLLNKCINEKLMIKVWTRTHKGIRGYCTGYIHLFDKHWNMFLSNVTEVWTRSKKRKVPAIAGEPPTKYELKKRPVYPPEIRIISQTKKTETCERNVDQLLIRGEQIAVIIVIPST